MKRLVTIIVLLLLLTTKCSAQSQQNKLDEINRQYEYYCEQGLYTNASNLLVEKGNEFLENGDTLTAYELQLRNCRLTDKHLDEMFQYGMTWEGYFANWYMTISIAAWLNMKEEIAPELLRILEMVSQKEPELLPFYASTLGFILYEYKTIENGEISILVLQKALDYIKSVSPSQDLVKQYNKITDCFYANRFYNSIEKNVLVKNLFDEIENWYNYNHQYIVNLDTSLFEREILEYELLFVEQKMFYASTISAQENKYYEAIAMYSDVISILQPIVKHKNTLSQKIAVCYAKIAKCYYCLGDMTLCKEYSDKAFPFLLGCKKDFEYCDLLNALSLTYRMTNQHELAAQFKLEEIIVREELGWNCTLGDWSMYFGCVQDPKKVLEYKDIAMSFASEGVGGSPDFYLKVGQAYSSLMKENEHYKDSAEYYFRYANNVFKSNKDYHDKYAISDSFKYNYAQAWVRHYIGMGQLQEAHEKAKEALSFPSVKNYYHYANVSLTASILHDTIDIHTFLPKYYYGLEKDLCAILPILGSLGADTYLGNGESSLYHIPELVSWNPNDSVSVSIAYDATLLMKGLTLRYNVLTPYFESHRELVNAKLELDRMRDSIYSITDDIARMMALHKYELKEREILKEINKELINVHWKDVANGIDYNEVCIEFVKFTANSYSWCNGAPKPHYAALVLCHNGLAPVFIDLFDEEEIVEIYNLQPKSYSTDIGQTIYSKIWGKLQPYIEGKSKVFFSPMGLLNLINIELLTDSSGKTAAERFNLYRVSSTRNVLTNTNKVKINSVAAFGGIDYEKASKYACVIDSINTRGSWAFLEKTMYEISQIKKSLDNKGVNVKTYTGSHATEWAFRQLGGTQLDIIHIASHGYYIPQSKRNNIPYFSNSENTVNVQDELFYSGLILSGGQKAWMDSTFKPDSNDGVLTAYEISKLDLHNVKLVVLSACETGLGDDLFDGIFGLQRAFKKAGVGSILMSLWKIDDKSTSEYMKILYENIAKGYSTHDAYINTMLAMKEKYQDTYYWASFILLD